MKKNWDNLIQIALLFVGTYGERFFMLIHTLICRMQPELFSFVCLSVIFVILTKMISKQ